MFLFEVVVGKVNSMVESRHLIIRSDFGDIFSLELKDPKTMHIVIPEPPPLPPEPPGKKGKKKPKPKPKGKKGKKGVEEAPPPEPVIQSGQSILFSSNAEFIIQTMKKFPLELSLWSKEDNLTYIGSTSIPWDPAFLTYLQKICDCQEPPPCTISDEYNIFEEGKGKLMAKIGLQIKLSYLTDKVTTAFRTLSDDPSVKKVLYTGINSKTTSYVCTLKTTDEEFEENCKKIDSNFVKDTKPPKIAYADYKNAPGANLTFFSDGDYCCMNNADKPPESIYKSPETCPDINFIIEYVRKIILSCNDNMRMLTPRPTIKPRIKATDIDRLCYCKETNWPEGSIAERFKNEAQSEPCPICINAGKKSEGSRGTTFDIANIKGPCGKTDCKVAKELRNYIENLIEEDNMEVNINDIIGPCGSKECRIAEKIQQFLRHEGAFTHASTLEGLSTQCACIKTMQDALMEKKSCDSSCSKDCADTSSEESKCDGKACPFKSKEKQIYNVYYFTVEYDLDTKSPGTLSPSGTNESSKSKTLLFKSDKSGTSSPMSKSDKSSKFKYCSSDCPSTKPSNTTCSKSVCSTLTENSKHKQDQICVGPVCPSDDPRSPADSEIVINFDEIDNPCCVKSCDVAERVKDFIVEGVQKKNYMKARSQEDDPCFCDCVCTFKLSKNTTYCGVCGGYECLGEDVQQMPEFAKPHPCPIYHKLYDKKVIKVHSPWSEEEETKKPPETSSIKSSRTNASKVGQGEKRPTSSRSMKNLSDKKINAKEKKTKPEKKQVGKFTANIPHPPGMLYLLIKVSLF